MHTSCSARSTPGCLAYFVRSLRKNCCICLRACSRFLLKSCLFCRYRLICASSFACCSRRESLSGGCFFCWSAYLCLFLSRKFCMFVFLSFSVAVHILCTKTGKSPQTIARFTHCERDTAHIAWRQLETISYWRAWIELKYFALHRIWRHACKSEPDHISLGWKNNWQSKLV